MKRIFCGCVLNGKGKVEPEWALIDDDMWDLLAEHSWHVQGRYKNGKPKAVATTLYISGRRTVYMHHVVFGCPINSNHLVDHIDRDPLNNQRKNLRIQTPYESNMNVGHYNGHIRSPTNKSKLYMPSVAFKTLEHAVMISKLISGIRRGLYPEDYTDGEDCTD